MAKSKFTTMALDTDVVEAIEALEIQVNGVTITGFSDKLRFLMFEFKTNKV